MSNIDDLKELQYRELTVIIPPNSTRTLNFRYESLTILDSNLPQNIYYRFANQNSFTTMESGLGFEIPKTQRNIDFKNEHKSETAIVKIALGSSAIRDNRMVVAGTVKVETSPDEKVYTAPAKLYPVAVSEQEIGTDGYVELDSGDYSFIRIQNISSNQMRLYGDNGFVLLPFGTEELNPRGTFRVYGAAGDKLVFGGFS